MPSTLIDSTILGNLVGTEAMRALLLYTGSYLE